jgi:hypothetical protein
MRWAPYVTSHNLPFHRISAVSGEGLNTLLETAWKYLTVAEGEPAHAGARRED